MRTENFWRQKILQCFLDKSDDETIYKVSTKEEIFRTFGGNLDPNTDVAWATLFVDGLILHCISNNEEYFIADMYEKLEEIKEIVFPSAELVTLEELRPSDIQTEGLIFQFANKSERDNVHQNFYFFYTKQENDTDWVFFTKNPISNKTVKYNLGSLVDESSRIFQIWDGILDVGEGREKGFIRKEVENKYQKCCGNNRVFSKASFDIFVHKNWLNVITQQKSKVYFIRDHTEEEQTIDNSKSSYSFM